MLSAPKSRSSKRQTGGYEYGANAIDKSRRTDTSSMTHIEFLAAYKKYDKHFGNIVHERRGKGPPGAGLDAALDRIGRSCRGRPLI
ncbi:hypothetical protein EVAR_69783_1 [Eumeta japonica]|uniref:Uncharacterized protein n=1 Tax=Eumeta variegata TaxID=151549 RepID=A0A4C2A688_EUMVA|nr:hypothetical protein EVAR_69783_1 [Eumeta japonica]